MRVCELTAAIVLVAFAGIGCGGDDGGADAIDQTGSASAAPTFSQAPVPLRQLEPVMLCGRERVGSSRRIGDRAARKCLGSAWRRGREAELISVAATIEGDPIRFYVRVREDDLLVIEDSTADRFGTREWSARGCLKLDAARLEFDRCTSSVTINGRTPIEVIERRTLPYCGRVNITSPREQNAAAVYQCMRKAERARAEAEFDTIEPAEEHPIERVIRLTRDGVEIYENSGGYSPDDDRWKYIRCDAFAGPRLLPEGCSAPVPLNGPFKG